MYLDFYNLKEIPFTASPPSGKVPALKNRRETVDRLLKGINKNGELKVLISEKGVGKTTLIHSLLESISDDFYVISILKPAKTTFDLLKLICVNLEIPFSSLPIDEIIPSILTRLKNIAKSGKKPLLILDDAHNSSKNCFEIIQNLFRLNKSISNFLRIFLVGEPILEKKLDVINRKAHREKNWSIIQLAKLDFNEAKKYIKNRLQSVRKERQIDEIFTENAIEKIFYYSNGNPRRINILCNNALILGYLQSAPKITSEIIEKVRSDEICVYEVKKLIGNRNKSDAQENQTTEAGKSTPLVHEKGKDNSLRKQNRVEKSEPLITAKTSVEPELHQVKWVSSSKGAALSPDPTLKSDIIKTNDLFVQLEAPSEDLARDIACVIDNMLLNKESRQLKIIGVTSPIPGQGSSTIAVEISRQLANRVESDFHSTPNGLLLMDTNFQHPLHELHRGLAEILSGEKKEIEEVVAKTNLNFSFLSTGKNRQTNLSQNITTRIETLFNYLRSRFNYIIVDLPPILHDQKSAVFAKFCDGIVVVVQAGSCKWEIVEESKKQLEKSGVPILGSVLNKRNFYIPNWLYKMV